MELSLIERLLMINQYKILGRLSPDLSDHYEELERIFSDGYTIFYGKAVEAIDEEMSEEECREVMDTLDLFRALHDASRRIDDLGLEESEASWTRFQGFDGNNEGRQFSFASFLIQDQGKWQESADCPMNSHAPMRDVYARMRTAWEQSADKFELTRDDVERILQARFHPDAGR